jgi:hypothetical protein
MYFCCARNPLFQVQQQIPHAAKSTFCEIAGASRGAGDDNSEELPIDKNGRSSGRPLLLL